MNRWSIALLGGLLGGLFACEDATRENDAGLFDGGAATDASFPAAFSACSPRASDEPRRGVGGCCELDVDCARGPCRNGYCTQTCSTDRPCGLAQAPSPFPEGTMMSCMGDTSFTCWPGSLRICTGSGSQPCPAGESCTTVYNSLSADRSNALFGRCMTSFATPDTRAPGAWCEASGSIYQCPNAAGFLGDRTHPSGSCVEHHCELGCDATNSGGAACPAGLECAGPLFLPGAGPNGSEVFYSGSLGLCLGASCGLIEVGSIGGMRTVVGDSACDETEYCRATIHTAENMVSLNCREKGPGSAGVGDACEVDEDGVSECWSYCLEGFEPMPEVGFCGRVCINDRDCDDASRRMVCTDDAIPECVPLEVLGYATECRNEAECGGATESCVLVSARSFAGGCRARSDLAGTPLSVGESCIVRSANHLDNDCKSGLCLDRRLRFSINSTQTRCAAYCRINADCASNQICTSITYSTNSTETWLDDSVVGYCLPVAPADAADACTTDADCTTRGGDRCDTDPTIRACFKSSARAGDPCTSDAECPNRGRCRLSPEFVGGYCVLWGCDPTIPSASGCPEGAYCGMTSPYNGVCNHACASDADCRQGYTCQDDDFDGRIDSCLP